MLLVFRGKTVNSSVANSSVSIYRNGGSTTVPAATTKEYGHLGLDGDTTHVTEPAAQRSLRQRQDVRRDFSLEAFIKRCLRDACDTARLG